MPTGFMGNCESGLTDFRGQEADDKLYPTFLRYLYYCDEITFNGVYGLLSLYKLDILPDRD